MRYKIEVKRKDINLGKCNDPRLCAVALAMNRRFGKRKGYEGAEVTEHSAEIRFSDSIEYVDFPKKVTDFIYRFDDKGNWVGERDKMKPFSFVVNV